MARFKRRIHFIEKAFQIRFMLKVIAIIALGTVITGTCLYVFGNYQISRMYSSAHYDLKESWDVFSQAVLVASFFSMTLVAALSVFFTLYDSHKIGGPLYRFRKNLEEIGEGDLTLHTKLRDGDELRPFVETMNDMTASLRQKVLDAREANRALLDLIGEAEAAGEGQRMAAFRRAAEETARRLDQFKVGG